MQDYHRIKLKLTLNFDPIVTTLLTPLRYIRLHFLIFLAMLHLSQLQVTSLSIYLYTPLHVWKTFFAS